MNNALLTVIITTYKREYPLLSEAVESVIAQTYRPIEIIVVDDNIPGSEYSAGLSERLAEYPEVTYIKMPQNGGAQLARNAGIDAAHGEFVGFLDDDDLWLPEKAERQMALLEDERVGLTYSKGYIFEGSDKDAKKPYATSPYFRPEVDFVTLLAGDLIGSTTQAIIRKSVFAVAGNFDPKQPARQDYEMWLRITKHGYLARGVDEYLFYHRMHGGEQISKVPQKSIDGLAAIKCKYMDDFKSHKRAYMHFLFIYALANKRGGNYMTALGISVKAFFTAPGEFFRAVFSKLGK